MNIIFLLLPIGLLMTVAAIAWFAWSVRTGQFDDLESPAYRMLFDDEQLTAESDKDEVPVPTSEPREVSGRS